jgi:hypothetical protein
MLTSAERLAMDAEMSKPRLGKAADPKEPIYVDVEAILGRPSTHGETVSVHRAAPAPTADAILDQARKEQADRAQFYDAPAGERSMAKTVAAFNAIFGTQLTEVQGWQFMELLKLVRSSQGKPRADNYVDGASYAALAGEAAMKGEMK